MIRRASTFNTSRIDHLYLDPHDPEARFFLHYGDLSDAGQLSHLIYNIQPEEVYHLAAQSHVRVSFDMPEYTGDTSGLGTTRLLLPRLLRMKRPQCDPKALTPLPNSMPIRWSAITGRPTTCLRSMASCSTTNRLSGRRTLLPAKSPGPLARIKLGLQKKLYLGNLEARRDWGYAPDFVEAMWLTPQQDEPADLVIATDEAHSVKEFLEEAF